MLSDTPIYDQLCWEHANRSIPKPPTTVELEIAVDTSKFMRAIGHVANERAAMFERSMTEFSGSLIPLLEYLKYPAAVRELSRNTGWSLEESSDVYQRVAKWSAAAITKADTEALGRSRMSKQNHYPTSTPSWARKKR